MSNNIWQFSHSTKTDTLCAFLFSCSFCGKTFMSQPLHSSWGGSAKHETALANLIRWSLILFNLVTFGYHLYSVSYLTSSCNLVLNHEALSFVIVSSYNTSCARYPPMLCSNLSLSTFNSFTGELPRIYCFAKSLFGHSRPPFDDAWRHLRQFCTPPLFLWFIHHYCFAFGW